MLISNNSAVVDCKHDRTLLWSSVSLGLLVPPLLLIGLPVLKLGIGNPWRKKGVTDVNRQTHQLTQDRFTTD